MTVRLSIGDHVCYQAIDNTQPETQYVTHCGYIEEFNCYMSKGDSEWQTAAKIRKDSGGHTWKEIKLLTKDVTGILSHLPGSGFHVGDNVTYDDFKGNVVGFKADPEGDRAVLGFKDGTSLYPRIKELVKVK